MNKVSNEPINLRLWYSNMRIISFDVDIINLAYTIIQYKYIPEKKKHKYKVLDWDSINLIDDQILECLLQVCPSNENSTFHSSLLDDDFHELVVLFIDTSENLVVASHFLSFKKSE